MSDEVPFAPTPAHISCMYAASVPQVLSYWVRPVQAEEEKARVKAEEDTKKKDVKAEAAPPSPANGPDAAGPGAVPGQDGPAANGPVSATASAG